MTDKRVKKLLVLLLLVNIIMASAFSFFPPLKPLNRPAENNIQSDKQTPDAHEQSAVTADMQKPYLESRLAAVSRPMEPSPESGEEILNSATNEDEALDELRVWARKDPESALVWEIGRAHV